MKQKNNVMQKTLLGILTLAFVTNSCLSVLIKAPDETSGITYEECVKDSCEVVYYSQAEDFYCDCNGILIQIKGDIPNYAKYKMVQANGDNK